MRKPRRDIEIFNMSLLDILCGALGAFCFLTLTLFPFYGRVEGAAFEEQKKLRTETQAIEKQIAELEAAGQDPAQLANIAETARREAAKLTEELDLMRAKKQDLARLKKELAALRRENSSSSGKNNDELKKELDDLQKKANKRRQGPTRTTHLLVHTEGLPGSDVSLSLQYQGAGRTNPSISGSRGLDAWASIAEPAPGRYLLVMEVRSLQAPGFGIDVCTNGACIAIPPRNLPVQAGARKPVFAIDVDPVGNLRMELLP